MLTVHMEHPALKRFLTAVIPVFYGELHAVENIQHWFSHMPDLRKGTDRSSGLRMMAIAAVQLNIATGLIAVLEMQENQADFFELTQDFTRIVEEVRQEKVDADEE